METIKVKPWGEGQGDYVLVNAKDFDEAVHVRLDAEPEQGARRGRRSKPEGEAE